MTLHKRAYVRPLCFFILTYLAGILLYHSLAGGTLLEHSPYDSYALLAHNWLQGNLHLPDGASRPWLELAIYNGRYYISFPPVPGLFVLPWVVLCGGAAAVPSHLVAALAGLAGAVGVYCLFARRRFAPAACVWWAAVCTAGSNLLWPPTAGCGFWPRRSTLRCWHGGCGLPPPIPPRAAPRPPFAWRWRWAAGRFPFWCWRPICSFCWCGTAPGGWRISC